MLHIICYLSEYAGARAAADNDVDSIVRLAKAVNPVHDITGVLFFHDNRFLQVIEGPEPALRALMRNIEKDSRHRNVEYLIDTPAQCRAFGDWNMDVFRFGPGRAFNPSTMRAFTKSFREFLLPHTELLVPYYKALLAKPSGRALG